MIVLMMAYLYKRFYLDHRSGKPGSVLKMPHFLMRLQPVMSKEKHVTGIIGSKKADL